MPPRKKAEPADAAATATVPFDPSGPTEQPIPEGFEPEAPPPIPTIGSLDYNPDGGRVLIDQR